MPLPPVSELEQQVRDYLTLQVQVARTHHHLPARFAYLGPADYVLRHGHAFTPQVLPARYRPGVPRSCFDNAYRLAARSRGALRYCEGYAAGLLPVEHGWCVAADATVVDPTWTGDRLGAVYLGVVLDLALVRAARQRGTASALFDWQHDYPLCQHPQHPAGDAP